MTTVPVIKLAFVVAVNTTLVVPSNEVFAEVITPSILKFLALYRRLARSVVPFMYPVPVPIVPICAT